jgi:hypothetical protein
MAWRLANATRLEPGSRVTAANMDQSALLGAPVELFDYPGMDFAIAPVHSQR